MKSLLFLKVTDRCLLPFFVESQRLQLFTHRVVYDMS
jgi:hypothetical protein